MLSKKAMMAAPAAVPLYIEDTFSTYLYTGNGTSQTITNGIDLAGEGGMVWIKQRNAIENHRLTDTARGATVGLFSNTASGNDTVGESLTAFTSTGFSLGSDSSGNQNTGTYASWTFRKAPKFFDVVTYTGNGATNRQINHNLGSAPGMVIAKCTNALSDWFVWHRSLSGTNYNGYLNDTLATGAYADFSSNGSGTMNSTSFCVNGSSNINGNTYVAYLFAHDAGGFGESGTDNAVSCGSFTISGSNVTTSLGYEPQYLLVKRTTSAKDWEVVDVMRDFGVSSSTVLYPNLDGGDGGDSKILLTSTGFTTTAALGNGDYIYLAIRRPNKPPTSGTQVFDTAVQTASSGSTPSFISGNVVDAALRRDLGVDSWNLASRLTGTARLRPDSTLSESDLGARSDYTWDYMSGWRTGSASATTYSWMFRRAPKFFDVVCYTGNGNNGHMINHNLTVIPELAIIKRRNSTGDWVVASSVRQITTNSNVQLSLNNTDAEAIGNGASLYANQSTATQVFINGTSTVVNASGWRYVMYLFATLPGISKVGSYTGTGTTLQINCGFTTGARFVLIKRTDSTGSWYVWDTARGIIAGNDPYLLLNSDAAEVTNTDYIDPLASGFEISSTAPAAINASGGSFIFLAIA